MIDLDDSLREIEESLADLRAELEPLESGEIRPAEIRADGSQTDTTAARVLWLKRLIASYASIATRIRAGEFR